MSDSICEFCAGESPYDRSSHARSRERWQRPEYGTDGVHSSLLQGRYSVQFSVMTVWRDQMLKE